MVRLQFREKVSGTAIFALDLYEPLPTLRCVVGLILFILLYLALVKKDKRTKNKTTKKPLCVVLNVVLLEQQFSYF